MPACDHGQASDTTVRLIDLEDDGELLLPPTSALALRDRSRHFPCRRTRGADFAEAAGQDFLGEVERNARFLLEVAPGGLFVDASREGGEPARQVLERLAVECEEARLGDRAYGRDTGLACDERALTEDVPGSHETDRLLDVSVCRRRLESALLDEVHRSARLTLTNEDRLGRHLQRP